eukprot:Skav229882  [mRNA]  locus=scaffold247:357098:359011:+ [translate_table: standard]
MDERLADPFTALFSAKLPRGHGVLASMRAAALPDEGNMGRLVTQRAAHHQQAHRWGATPIQEAISTESAANGIPQPDPKVSKIFGDGESTRDKFFQAFNQLERDKTTEEKGITSSGIGWWRAAAVQATPQRKTPTSSSRTARAGKHGADGKSLREGKGEGTLKKAKKTKGGLDASIKAALDPRWVHSAIKNLQAKLFAPGTLASKNTKRSKLIQIMNNCQIDWKNNCLDHHDLETIAAVLSESEIRSADQYLSEVKLMQLEAGLSWTDVADRQLCILKRGLKRDLGPEKRALEVPPQELTYEQWHSTVEAPGVPARIGLAYVWACLWMLRSTELVALKIKDVTMLRRHKRVQLWIRKSKMDQKAIGVKRTLECCQFTPCLRECVWNVATKILADLSSFDPQDPLFPDFEGAKVVRTKMVASWSENLRKGMSGHSGRRSGAMFYTRRGFSIHQVATLGRWRSSAVLRYVEEAMQDIPMNASAGTVWEGAKAPTVPEETEKTEPVSKKEKSNEEAERKPTAKAAAVTVKAPEEFWAVSTSRGKRMAHKVRQASWSLPLEAWDTWCGWHFAAHNVRVSFIPNPTRDTPKCKKCLKIFKERDYVRGGVSLAQLVQLPNRDKVSAAEGSVVKSAATNVAKDN